MSGDSQSDTEVKQVNRVATPLCVDKQSVDVVVQEAVSRVDDDGALTCVERVREESEISGTSDDDVVTVSFGNGDIVARKDSGTDVSVVHPSCIPVSVLYQARQSGDIGAIRDVKLMGAFVNTGVTAELIHLPCHLVKDGRMCNDVVITCAVTDRLREKMLLKPSDLKLLEECDNMMTSYRDDGYTFENSWYDMVPLAERVERVGLNGDENEGVASGEDVVSKNDCRNE